MRRLARRQFLRSSILGTAAAFGHAFWLEPNWLSVTRASIDMPHLPTGLDGLRVALFADVHFKPGTDDALLERLVQTCNASKPDLIAIAGDYVEHDAGILPPMLDRLRHLHAAHGVFAVMGNHDGWTVPGESVRRQFEKAGIAFLINQHSRLNVRGTPFAVAGTDHVWSGRPDPLRAFRGLAPEIPTLALVHEPDYFDTVHQVRPGVLQLSGHTHGGQCQVPLVGFAPAKVSHGQKYIYGRFRRGKSRLFVTRGVGTTGLRVRFACRPELALLTLRARA